MKRTAPIIVVFILVAGLPLGALELGTFFDIGNMSFPETPLTTTDFPSDSYPWGLTVTGRQVINEGMEINFGYTNDRVVNHLVHSTFIYNGEFFSIGAGPAFGVLNSTTTPLQPGMSTESRVAWPGKLFLSFDMFSSIGYRLSSPGDYSQSKNNLTIGFYVPNAICTVGMDQKSYTEVVSTYGEGTDKQTDFSFKADIFQKNVPFRVLIGLIYRQHSKEYMRNLIDGTLTHTPPDDPAFSLAITPSSLKESLNSILLQSKVTFQVTPYLTLMVDAHSNLFSFGKITNDETDADDLMSIPSTLPDSFLFEVKVGFTFDLDAWKENR